MTGFPGFEKSAAARSGRGYLVAWRSVCVIIRSLTLGPEPAGAAPKEFADFMRRQNDRYGAAVKARNVRLD